MSTVNANNKHGHPVTGIVLGIAGMAVALLTTILFGVIAGAAAGLLGIGAALLGISARKSGNRGTGAVVAGVMAIVLAVSMTVGSVNMMKQLRETAASTGVAPTLSRYLDNPCLGLSPVLANALNAGNDDDAARTLQDEMDALIKLMANGEQHAAENANIAG